MDDRIAVQTDDLRVLAGAFTSGASDLSASGQYLDSVSTMNGSPLGQGENARSATEAYTKTQAQLINAYNQLGALSARAGDALKSTVKLYEGNEAANVQYAKGLDLS